MRLSTERAQQLAQLAALHERSVNDEATDAIVEHLRKHEAATDCGIRGCLEYRKNLGG